MPERKILVTGATGLSGSFIVNELVSQQISFRVLVRDREKTAGLQSLNNVEIAEGDMLQPDSFLKALENVERALLISTSNDRMVETQCSFIDACKAAGVAHVIKFSGEESQVGYNPKNFRFTREHEQIEDYLENSGLLWTHLRPSQFMQMYLREAVSIKNKGSLFLPLENITMSPVDLQDVAKVAVAILKDGGHTSESLRMTGPGALSMADIAAIITRVTGTTVNYVPIAAELRSSILHQAGLPSYLVEAVSDQAAERSRNPRAFVDLGSFELFDITPTPFEQFVGLHISDFKPGNKEALNSSV